MFAAADEVFLRGKIQLLAPFEVEREGAVLLAADDGALGSWNLEGARTLAGELDSARSPGLQQVSQELREAVSAA